MKDWITGNRILWLLLPAVVLITLLAYSPSLLNGFVWDDRFYLFDPEMTDTTLWTEKLRQNFLGNLNYYRPLPLLTFIGQTLLHGSNPLLFHLVNVLLHGLNTLLVGILCYQASRTLAGLERGHWVAAAAALVYGLHPANIEAVAWISGRFDLMLTTFLLLALLADANVRRVWLRAVLVGVCYFGAAASKEMAVGFPFVLLLAWHLARSPRPLWPLPGLITSFFRRGEAYVYLAVIAGGLGYLAWRYGGLGYLLAQMPAQNIDHWPVRPLLIAKSFGWYLLTTVYPFPWISPLHPRPPILQLNDPLAWLGLGVVLLTITGLVVLIRRAPRQGWLWAAFVLAFLPVLHIMPMTIADNYVHDRFLVFPLAMFAVALTVSASGWLTRPHPQAKAIRWGTALVLSFFSVWSLAYVQVTVPLWHDNLRLWSWATQKNPTSATAHSALGDEYLLAGRFADALAEGTIALRLNPGMSGPWSVSGHALANMGRFEEALVHHQAALQISPGESRMWHSVGAVLLELGRYQIAEEYLLKSHQMQPYDRRINTSLGMLYLRTGKLAQARKHFELAAYNFSARNRRDYQNVIRERAGPRYAAKVATVFPLEPPATPPKP